MQVSAAPQKHLFSASKTSTQKSIFRIGKIKGKTNKMKLLASNKTAIPLKRNTKVLLLMVLNLQKLETVSEVIELVRWSLQCTQTDCTVKSKAKLSRDFYWNRHMILCFARTCCLGGTKEVLYYHYESIE